MADIAALLETRSGSQAVQTPAEESRIRAVLNQLYSWRWSWEARNQNAVFEVSGDDLSPFETVLHYAFPLLMYEIWLYNALQILVLDLLAPLDFPSSPQRHGRSGLLLLPGKAESPQSAAIEICRSFEYQLLHLDAHGAVHQWAMPLALAYVTINSTDPVAIWVLRKIHAAPIGRSRPWLLHIGRLQGIDRDAMGNIFSRWPVSRTSS